MVPLKYFATIPTVLQVESWVVKTSVFTVSKKNVISAMSVERHSLKLKAPCSIVLGILNKSLRRVLYLADNNHRWIPMTPAMAVGITEFGVWVSCLLIKCRYPLGNYLEVDLLSV